MFLAHQPFALVLTLFLPCNLTSYRTVHFLANDLWVIVLPLQVHQFGNRSLYRTVVSANDTSIFQLITCIVARHLYITRDTLTDVHHDDATVGRFV